MEFQSQMDQQNTHTASPSKVRRFFRCPTLKEAAVTLGVAFLCVAISSAAALCYISSQRESGCGTVNTDGWPKLDATTAAMRVAEADMAGRTKAVVDGWIAEYSEPRDAWCASKLYREEQNYLVSLRTITEVNRNAEHYLFARYLVGEFPEAVRPGIAYATVVLTRGYSFLKYLPMYQDSPPTAAEEQAGVDGAWAGITLP